MAATCETCGLRPPLPGFKVCSSCLLLGVAGDFVERYAAGPAGAMGKAAVDQLGPLAVDWVRARLRRRQQQAAETCEGLELLKRLAFIPAGEKPTRAEVEAFRRRMTRAYHHDGGPAPVAGDMMSRINAACDRVLMTCET